MLMRDGSRVEVSVLVGGCPGCVFCTAPELTARTAASSCSSNALGSAA
jgi:hypothetical protein